MHSCSDTLSQEPAGQRGHASPVRRRLHTAPRAVQVQPSRENVSDTYSMSILLLDRDRHPSPRLAGLSQHNYV